MIRVHLLQMSPLPFTRIRSLALRHASGDRTPLTVDVTTGVTYGSNANMFNNYHGVLPREKMSILVHSLDHVPKVD